MFVPTVTQEEIFWKAMTARVVQQVFAFAEGRHDEVLAWLEMLGHKVRVNPEGRLWTIDTLHGMTVGLMPSALRQCANELEELMHKARAPEATAG